MRSLSKRSHTGIAVLALSLACLRLPAYGAEEVCDNVEDSAVVHYSSDSSAEKTESGADCTISIDGADASSMGIPEVAIWCAGRAFQLGILGDAVSADYFAKEIVPLMMLPSLLKQSGAPFPAIEADTNWPETFSNEECANWTRNASQMNFDFSSPLHEEFDDDDDIVNEVAACLRDANGSGSCFGTATHRVIVFETDFGRHTLSLPLPRQR